MAHARWLVCLALLFLAACGQAEDPPPIDVSSVADDPMPGSAPVAADKPALVLDAGGHTAPIRKVVFTPDGKRLISVSLDKSIRVWDTATGELLRVLRPPIDSGTGGMLVAAALSPDGRTLAVSGYGPFVDGKRTHPIWLIDLNAGRMRDKGVLPGHADTLRALAFSPDGKLLASGGKDKVVRIWDLETGECRHVLKGHNGIVRDLAFSPDGERLASGSDDATVLLWDVSSGKPQKLVQNGTGKDERAAVTCLAWSPDGKTLATPGRGGSYRLWDSTGKLKATHRKARTGGYLTLGFTPDSRSVFAIAQDGWYANLDLRDAATGDRRPGHFNDKPDGVPAPHPLWCGAVSRDGKLVALAGTRGHALYLYSGRDGTYLRRMAGRAAAITRLGWGEAGSVLAWRITATPNPPPVFPMERSFHLTDLRLGQALFAEVREGVKARDGLALQPAPGNRVLEVQSRRKGVPPKVLARLTPPDGHWTGDYSFVGLDKVALAGNVWGLQLFETHSGKGLVFYGTSSGAFRLMAPSPDGRYLATTGEENVLRMWGTTSPDPLLSLFVVGSEWVAWAPGGYYAASPGGEHLMGWQINNGPDQLGTFLPASRFRASLNRPDIIQRLLATGSVTQARQEADKARGVAKSVAVEVDQVLPPQVSLRALGDKNLQKLSDPTLEVEAVARARGKHAVTSLMLLLDGRPYVGAAASRAAPKAISGVEVRQRWTIQVPEGEHALRVVARSEASMGLSDDLDVNYAHEAPKPKLFVLAIGIDDYKGHAPPLNCAVNDARELAKAFAAKSKDLFEVQTRLLVEDSQVTRQGITEALGWLKGMSARDVAVVFFAGHGERDAKGNFYLLPQDVDASRLETTAVNGATLKDRLAGLPGKVVLLLDACHSGAVGKVMGELARDLADEDCGVIVMCAALGSETAGEDSAVKHGYFCLAILEALRGKAHHNPRDGYVYQHHLEQYVIDRVQDLSKDSQHPTSAKPTMRPFPLAKP